MALGYKGTMRPNAYVYGQHPHTERTWHKTLEAAETYKRWFVYMARNVWHISAGFISIEQDFIGERPHGYVLTMETVD